MKYSVLTLLMVCSTLLAEPVGTINLNLAFYYHPMTILYYYPEAGTFLRPVEGKLTVSAIEEARKTRSVEKDRLKARNKTRNEEIAKRLNDLAAEKNQTCSRILGMKSSLFEEQQKKMTGKVDIAKLNLQFHDEAERAMKPYQDKLDSLELETLKLNSEQLQLKQSESSVEFYTTGEAAQLTSRILAEIKTALKTVADKKGIKLVLNSGVYENLLPSGSSDSGKLTANYERVNMMSVGEPNLAEGQKMSPEDKIKTFTMSYLSELIAKKSSPMARPDFSEFIQSESQDLTYEVVESLIGASEINPKFKAAVLQYLKDNLKS
ncbi:MAG: hypothetical protein PHW04_01380 [Candidatus Wallbacteria bacterium]|nr:hypothetical protein [Candidatus Wallbacteria bacterium]